MNKRRWESPKIRYAVVGLGYIAQSAVLPAFENARDNSELVALVSDNPEKLKILGRKYKVAHQCSYNQYDDLLRSGAVDAVYIALPNHLHSEYTLRAASAGVHVLCEKPLAVTEEECQEMIDAAAAHKIKLMTAYRLHFDEANLRAVKVVQSGKLGRLRIFNSVFAMQVKQGDIRLREEMGEGTLYDLGVYCINAARYLFRAEPVEVSASTVRNTDPRFREVDEMTSAVLRFPDGELASFTVSFGAAENSWYQVVGTKGNLYLRNAYEYAKKREQCVEFNGKMDTQMYKIRDQFAPELLYFSDCIINNKKPETSGEEGLIDVKTVRALYRSAEAGHAVSLNGLSKGRRPSLRQKITRPKVREPELVYASAPSED